MSLEREDVRSQNNLCFNVTPDRVLLFFQKDLKDQIKQVCLLAVLVGLPRRLREERISV